MLLYGIGCRSRLRTLFAPGFDHGGISAQSILHKRLYKGSECVWALNPGPCTSACVVKKEGLRGASI
jgi:hypothetical protein